MVLFDGPRSAEPPRNHGMFWARTLSTLPEASRPAIPFGSAGKTGRVRSHPAGSSRRCIRSISAASSGYLARYPSKSFHRSARTATEFLRNVWSRRCHHGVRLIWFGAQKAVLVTGSDKTEPRKRHPPIADRIEVIALLDEQLPSQPLREAAAIQRRCFAQIIEIIWDVVVARVREAISPRGAACRRGS